MKKGKARKEREKEGEAKGGTYRIKTTQRRKPLFPGNMGCLCHEYSYKLSSCHQLCFLWHFHESPDSCPCSFVVSRIIECFWILHSLAAPCCFSLILFLTKERTISQTIFCSFSFPIDIQDLLTHCLIESPVQTICKACGRHPSNSSIGSPSVFFIIDESRAKNK